MEALKIPTRKEQKAAKKSKDIVDRISDKHENSSENIEIALAGEAEHVKIPVSAFRYLSTILEHMAQGKAITVNSVDAEITTQEAADLLNVSRPYLVKLLEEGKMPFHKVGSHRRIKLEDLLAYKHQMEEERKEALTELTLISQELGLDY